MNNTFGLKLPFCFFTLSYSPFYFLSTFIFFISFFLYSDLLLGKKKIIVSTTQIYDFAQQVVGDSMEVESILAEGLDPHTYIPTPKDVQKVLSGDILLQNGLHLEGKNWMAKLAKESKKKVVTLSQGIHPIYIKQTNTKKTILVADPHAWFSVPNAAIYVKNILKAVIELAPENKTYYQERTQLYLYQLEQLHQWLKKQSSRLALEKTCAHYQSQTLLITFPMNTNGMCTMTFEALDFMVGVQVIPKPEGKALVNENVSLKFCLNIQLNLFLLKALSTLNLLKT